MNKSLERKIEKLFVYREFPQLFELAGEKYKGHPLVKKLKNLQKEIYFLDHHLETNWEINPKKDLKPYWTKIYQALKECGVKKKDYDDYCKLIYKYQKHELYLRQNKLPIDFNIEYYYYFKSCDVKLLRRIISDHFPLVKRQYPASHWRYFDLISELNDDVEDLFEDMTTINGNYVLIDFIKNGVKITEKNTTQFINETSKKDKQRLRSKGKEYKWCSQLTQRECKLTLQLLKKNAPKLNKKKIKIESYIS